MAYNTTSVKRALDVIEDLIDQGPAKVNVSSPSRRANACFAKCCSDAGVVIEPTINSVSLLDKEQCAELALKKQFKVYFRVYDIDDPRNHIQLVTSSSSNFKSLVNGPHDIFNPLSYVVCTTMAQFFNVKNEWASFVFYASMPSSQFFHPTRFETIKDKRRVRFPLAPVIETNYVTSLEAAQTKAMELISTTPVFSLTAEPGTGKTTVLPFSFVNSRVAVVLPTGFDAWSAFKTASQSANLFTLTSRIDSGSHVTYFDSYTMAGMLYSLEGKLPFDIVIIDESDSHAGVTKTLTELRIPGISVIHLSGTSQEKSVRSAASFPIEKSYSFPPLHDKFFEAVDYVKANSLDVRTLVMCPDAEVATQVHKMIANSKLICEDSSIDDLEEVFNNQHDKSLIVCDDSCTRGFNLNLDVVFDFQLVGVLENRRVITDHEQTQRMMRVGRNKSGLYYAPKHELGVVSYSQLDVFRNNVARYMFMLPLHACDLDLDESEVYKLALSAVEPYVRQVELVASRTPSPKSTSSASIKSRSPSIPGTIRDPPRWALWAAGCSNKKRTLSSSSTGSGVLVSSSDSERDAGDRRKVTYVKPTAAGRPVRQSTNVGTFMGRTGDSIVSRPKPQPKFHARPPPIDLSLEHDSIDWPGALADCVSEGLPSPFMVPYGGWTYTIDGSSSGVDYIQRVSCVITDGPTFSRAEFEVVCRAWNVLAARSAFSFASGRDAWNDAAYVTFCLEYFHSFISIA